MKVMEKLCSNVIQYLFQSRDEEEIVISFSHDAVLLDSGIGAINVNTKIEIQNALQMLGRYDG